jgi:surface protein
MPFDATVDLGTVGSTILSATVSISACTGFDCSDCSLLVSDEPVSSFPQIISNIPDFSQSLFFEVDNGPCSGTSQCILVNPFIGRFTASPGLSNVVELPYNPSGTYSGTIDWGDGTISANTYSARTHTYASSGDYTITILGELNGWSYGSFATNYRDTIKEIIRWGPFRGSNTSNASAFFQCQNLTITGVTDTINLSGITSLSTMFRGCTSITTINQLDNWDLTDVTNLSSMFFSATSFNQNIGSWETSAVTNMSNTFSYSSSFDNGGNNSISGWNVSNVSNMTETFAFATSFNRNIGGWDIRTSGSVSLLGTFWNATSFNNGGSPSISAWTLSSCTITASMFKTATSFNQPIGNWDTQNVTNMSNMFQSATTFNQNISNWNTDSVQLFNYMFWSATSFNNGGSSSISAWTVSAATNMTGMFSRATSFDQPIGSWDTRNVTRMAEMFFFATSFDQPIGTWNTSKNITFNQTFFGASSFNQDIGNWVLSACTDMDLMFLQATSFDNGGSPSISGWNVSNVITMRTVFHSTPFNQPIGNWNTSKVTTMSAMFFNTSNFNQDISGWETSGITWTDVNTNGMREMFGQAAAFNQDLSSWCVANLLSKPFYFDTLASAWAGGTATRPQWGVAC